MSNDTVKRPDSRRVSWFFPLVLIAAGLLLLLDNLGLLGASFWNTFLRLWPLLLVAWGIESLFNQREVFGAYLLTGAGMIFLFDSFDLFGVQAWGALARLWPLLIIAAGVSVLVGKRNLLMAALAWLSLLALTFFLLLWGGRADGQLVPGESLRYPLDGVQSAQVRLNPAIGSLQLRADPEGADLFNGEMMLLRGEQVFQSFAVTEGRADLHLWSAGQFFIIPSGNSAPEWQTRLSGRVPITLQSELGVGQMHLDLTGLQIEGVTVNLGVGDILLTLPNQGNFNVEIRGGIGQMRIRVPRGMGVQVRSETGLANFRAPSEYTREGDVWFSPGYSGSEYRLTLTLSQGIGSIMIESLP
ncbi:MAG: DUF5668 domain-containing protein [Anaerolineales bacterium]